ncbi:MAG: hypothetical protein CL488_00305 [Acidobacteria bacterium]|nr:hypothetical protein [Acidobacteriota bacterium]
MMQLNVLTALIGSAVVAVAAFPANLTLEVSESGTFEIQDVVKESPRYQFRFSDLGASSSAQANLPQPVIPSLVRSADDPLVDESNLPPFSFTCPMHPEIHETHNVPCPICNMNLVETRRAEAWTCPIHSVILEGEDGVCPIGGRPLMPIRLELTWTCSDHPEVTSSEPGICPIDRQQKLVQRLNSLPHEDHSPKHGGTFFMAPDNWHHLEGTYPDPGRFVLYLYDNYSQPMNTGVATGRAVLRETYNVSLDSMVEDIAYPLTVGPEGRFFEVHIGEQELPTAVTAKIRFEPGAVEERFDFIFNSITDNPADPTSLTPRSVGLGGTQASLPPAAATTGTLLVNIPEEPNEIATELAIRNATVQNLVRDGGFTEIWIPALEAKDLALALTPHLDLLAPDQQLLVRLAVKELVRAAWLLDWHGDLGNRQRVEAAYAIFGQAADIITATYDRQ